MGWGSWMVVQHSLESEASMAICRQELRAMTTDQLRAAADHLVVLSHNQDRLLRGAMRRIAELEVQRALVDVNAAATSLQRPKQGKLRALLHWFTRWRVRIL
jgi:hypothetical protein